MTTRTFKKVNDIFNCKLLLEDGSEFEKNLYKMLSEIRLDTIDDSSEIELKINKVIASLKFILFYLK